MITRNCHNCKIDGNCVCDDLFRDVTDLKTNSEVYVPGRHIEIMEIINSIGLGDLYTDYTFRLFNFPNTDDYLIRLEYPEADVLSANLCLQRTRQWFIGHSDTENEILRTVRKLLLCSLEHRLDENFSYKGERVFNPHKPYIG